MSLRCPRGCRILVVMPAGLSVSPPLDVATSAGVGLTRDEVMTAGEVADLLHMPVSTVYYLARRGEIPAHRFGRTWRFLRPRLEELLRT
jgi:excisionase family DNA binding protein